MTRGATNRFSALAVVAVAALTLYANGAFAQLAPTVPTPRTIAHSGPLVGKPDALFDQIKTNFSDGRFGPYTIVSTDPARHTIVVRRNNIESADWARWAYCPMGPLDLLDSLRDGSVTMNVKLEPTTRWTTWAVVKAEFIGTYGLGASVKRTQCVSTGVLEEDVLRRLGANP